MTIIHDYTVEELLDINDNNSTSSVYERMGSAPSINASRSRAITQEERDSWDSLKQTFQISEDLEREALKPPVTEEPTRVYPGTPQEPPDDEDYMPEGW